MKSQMQTSPSLSRGAFLRSILLGLPLLPLTLKAQETPSDAAPAVDLGNLRAIIALARSDIRTEKAAIIAQNIHFTDDEALEFWPAHREYELELDKLLDQRYALILQFAQHFGTMTDADARTLANKVFDLEARRTALKRKYFKRFGKIVPALKAAQFFQIENQINLAIDLQLAASLPLIR
jgi:hypothetical protein